MTTTTAPRPGAPPGLVANPHPVAPTLRHSASFSCLYSRRPHRARTATLPAPPAPVAEVDTDYGFVVRGGSNPRGHLHYLNHIHHHHHHLQMPLPEDEVAATPRATPTKKDSTLRDVLVKKSASLLSPTVWWPRRQQDAAPPPQPPQPPPPSAPGQQRRWRSLGALLRTPASSAAPQPPPQSFYLLDDFLGPTPSSQRGSAASSGSGSGGAHHNTSSSDSLELSSPLPPAVPPPPPPLRMRRPCHCRLCHQDHQPVSAALGLTHNPRPLAVVPQALGRYLLRGTARCVLPAAGRTARCLPPFSSWLHAV